MQTRTDTGSNRIEPGSGEPVDRTGPARPEPAPEPQPFRPVPAALGAAGALGMAVSGAMTAAGPLRAVAVVAAVGTGAALYGARRGRRRTRRRWLGAARSGARRSSASSSGEAPGRRRRARRVGPCSEVGYRSGADSGSGRRTGPDWIGSNRQQCEAEPDRFGSDRTELARIGVVRFAPEGEPRFGSNRTEPCRQWGGSARIEPGQGPRVGLAARAEPVITGQLAKMRRRIGSVRGGRVLLATGSVAWQGVCALSRVTWWIARTSTPRAVKRRLRRAWIVLTTPRGWAERLVDPFWRAKYGQLSPREQWIVAFLLGMWDPIVTLFAKEPPPRRIGDRAERPTRPAPAPEPHDEKKKKKEADMTVEIQDLRELGEELGGRSLPTPGQYRCRSSGS